MEAQRLLATARFLREKANQIKAETSDRVEFDGNMCRGAYLVLMELSKRAMDARAALLAPAPKGPTGPGRKTNVGDPNRGRK